MVASTGGDQIDARADPMEAAAADAPAALAARWGPRRLSREERRRHHRGLDILTRHLRLVALSEQLVVSTVLDRSIERERERAREKGKAQ